MLGPFLFVRGAEVAVEGLLSTQLAEQEGEWGEWGVGREMRTWDGGGWIGGWTFWPQGQALG